MNIKTLLKIRSLIMEEMDPLDHYDSVLIDLKDLNHVIDIGQPKEEQQDKIIDTDKENKSILSKIKLT